MEQQVADNAVQLWETPTVALVRVSAEVTAYVATGADIDS